MLALTFAGDESGDVSFSFDKGASRYFVIAIIAVADTEMTYKLLEELRKKSHLSVNYEFKFHALSSTSLRQRVFTALEECEFEAWSIVVDKTQLPDTFKVMYAFEFYLYFVSELIQSIPVSKREGATLILDEFGTPTQLPTELRRILKLRGIPRYFKRIVAKRSSSEPLIQIADLVVSQEKDDG